MVGRCCAQLLLSLQIVTGTRWNLILRYKDRKTEGGCAVLEGAVWMEDGRREAGSLNGMHRYASQPAALVLTAIESICCWYVEAQRDWISTDVRKHNCHTQFFKSTATKNSFRRSISPCHTTRCACRASEEAIGAQRACYLHFRVYQL